MKAPSGIRLSVVASVAVSAVIGLAAFYILRGLNAEYARSERIAQIADKTHALQVLTAGFKEESAGSDVRQAKEVNESLDGLLKGMSSREPREEVLIEQLEKNQDELGPLIDEWSVSGRAGSGIEGERREILGSQIWMKAQFIADDSRRLKEISERRIIGAQRKTATLVAALMVLLVVTNGAIYLFSARKILRAQEGMRSVALFPEENPGPVARMDGEGKLLFANRASSELLAEWRCAVGDVVPEDLRVAAQDSLRYGKARELEKVVGGRTISLVLTPIGERGYVNLYGRDVTEQKRAEEGLEKAKQQAELQRQRLQTILETTPSAVIVVEAPDGKFTFINERAQALYGVDFKGVDLQTNVAKVKASLPDGTVIGADKVPLGRALWKGEFVRNEELVIYRTDGLCIPILASAAPIRNAQGDVVAAVAICEDITERKRAEDARRAAEHRFRRVGELIPFGAWEADLEGNATYLSPLFLEMTGQTLEEHRRTWQSLLHGDDAPILSAWRKCMAAGGDWHQEFRIRGADGQYRTVSARGVPVRNGAGQITSYVGLNYDITERKRAEQNREFLLDLSEKLARLADGKEIMRVAAERIGAFYGAAHCIFSEFEKSGDTARVLYDWRREDDGVDYNNSGVMRSSDYLTGEFQRLFFAGLPLVVCDTETDERTVPNIEMQRRVKNGAILAAPFLSSGDLKFTLNVTSHTPRKWREDEIQFLLELAQRVWAHVERARAVEKLRQSEERFRRYFELGVVGMAVTSPSKGWLEVNDECCRLLGYEREELAQKTWAELTHPDDLAADAAQFDKLLAGEINGYKLEKRFVRKDGQVVETIMCGAAIRDAEGKVDYCVTLLQDITQRKRAEEAVRQRTEELQTLLDTTPAAIFMAHDPECRRITGNPAAQELVGLPPEANISKSAPVEERPTKWQEMREGVPIAPDDLPLQRAARGEEVRDYEMDMVFQDGTVKSVVGHATALRDESGKPRGGVAILMDVTKRKRAEEAVRESEERARLALEAGEMGTWDRLMPDGPAVWNEDHYRMLGYEPGEVTPSKEAWEARVHPEDLRMFYERIAVALKDGGDFDEQLRIVWPSGEVRWVEMRGSIRCDSKGQPRRSYGVVVDFTERKRAEEELRISGERLKQATAVAGMGTFEHDHISGRVEYSPVLRELMGFGAEEKVSLAGIVEKVVPEDREAMVQAVHRAHDPAGEGQFAVDHRVRSADGRVRWISVRSQTFFEGEGSGRRPVRTIGAGLDVTERKEAQAELQRLVDERTAKLQELVGELEHFSYTITHDLKSPLRAMRGFAEMMNTMTCAECERTQPKEFLGRIMTSAERMDRLIADALSYSRSVRQELPLEDVDAGALLRGMLDSYPELQPEKAGIRVEGRLPVVLANEAGLTQCFSNLLGNAVKFVKRGEVPDIRVWSADCGMRNGWVRIWVEDKGIGIAKEMLPRVFDMFARGAKDYEGTGIGLALVRKVAQRMGGRVGVESEEGKGSRFWIELKRAEGPSRGGAGAVPAGAGVMVGTVLYAEDESGDALFMERAFGGKGWAANLRLVEDGRAAIDYLSGAGKYGDRERYPVPAVVLLDLNLPHVAGFEVLRWMRNNPDFAKTPVVVFSSSTREDDRVRARELGANEFVSKPSSGLEFGEVVEGLRGRWMGRGG